MSVSWTATDAGSGVKSFDVKRSKDGGAYERIASAITAASLNTTMTPGHTYKFKVRGRDNAGQRQLVGRVLDLARRPDPADDLRRDLHGDLVERVRLGVQRRQRQVRHRGRARARPTRSTAASVAWVTRLAPTSGAVQVYVDGVLVGHGRHDRRCHDSERVVAFSKSWSSYGSAQDQAGRRGHHGPAARRPRRLRGHPVGRTGSVLATGPHQSAPDPSVPHRNRDFRTAVPIGTPSQARATLGPARHSGAPLPPPSARGAAHACSHRSVMPPRDGPGSRSSSGSSWLLPRASRRRRPRRASAAGHGSRRRCGRQAGDRVLRQTMPSATSPTCSHPSTTGTRWSTPPTRSRSSRASGSRWRSRRAPTTTGRSTASAPRALPAGHASGREMIERHGTAWAPACRRRRVAGHCRGPGSHEPPGSRAARRGGEHRLTVQPVGVTTRSSSRPHGGRREVAAAPFGRGGLRREVFGFLPYWELSDSSDRPRLADALDGRLLQRRLHGVRRASRSGTPTGRPTTGWAGWTSSKMTSIINAAHQHRHPRRADASRASPGRSAGATHPGQRCSAARRAAPTLARQVAAAVRDRGADGVNLDFEPIVAGLRRRVHGPRPGRARAS